MENSSDPTPGSKIVDRPNLPSTSRISQISSRLRLPTWFTTSGPITKWKAIDPRLRNVYVGAAVACPSFIAGLLGVGQAVKAQEVLYVCANRPVASDVPSKEICVDAKAASQEGIGIAAGGAGIVVTVGGITFGWDKRLQRGAGKSPRNGSAAGPNPPSRQPIIR